MKTITERISELLETNPKIANAWEIFEESQKVYDQSVNAMTSRRPTVPSGTYSGNISKRGYHADISTTTQ